MAKKTCTAGLITNGISKQRKFHLKSCQCGPKNAKNTCTVGLIKKIGPESTWELVKDSWKAPKIAKDSKPIFLYESIYAMAIDKFLYL